MVASLVAVRLFDEWFSFLPAGSLEPLRIDLDLTYEQLSVLLVLMTVGGLAGGVCAVAADRVSRRAQSSLGALGYAVSMACWGLGDRFWILAAGSFLLGVSSDALLSACEVALVDLAGDDDLVTVLAPGTIAAEVGDLLGPLLLALTAAIGWGYRAPFLVGAVVLLVYAVVLALQPLPPPTATEEPTTARADVWACLRDRQVWQLGLISLLSDTLDEPLLGFAIAYLEVDRGQPHGVAVLVGGSVVVGGIVGAAAMAARVRGGTQRPRRPQRPTVGRRRAGPRGVRPRDHGRAAHPAAGPVRADHRHGQRHLLDPVAGPHPRTPAGPARHDGRGRRLPGHARRPGPARRGRGGRPPRPRCRARGLRRRGHAAHRGHRAVGPFRSHRTGRRSYGTEAFT